MIERILFDEPVVVWLVPDRHDLGVRRIWDVQEGRAALFRYGIGSLRQSADRDGRRVWSDASRALLDAKRDPCPDAIRVARGALLQAARRAGALPCPDPLPTLIAEGYDFAP
jgi:hypothetical protein